MHRLTCRRTFLTFESPKLRRNLSKLGVHCSVDLSKKIGKVLHVYQNYHNAWSMLNSYWRKKIQWTKNNSVVCTNQELVFQSWIQNGDCERTDIHCCKLQNPHTWGFVRLADIFSLCDDLEMGAVMPQCRSVASTLEHMLHEFLVAQILTICVVAVINFNGVVRCSS